MLGKWASGKTIAVGIFVLFSWQLQLGLGKDCLHILLQCPKTLSACSCFIWLFVVLPRPKEVYASYFEINMCMCLNNFIESISRHKCNKWRKSLDLGVSIIISFHVLIWYDCVWIKPVNPFLDGRARCNCFVVLIPQMMVRTGPLITKRTYIFHKISKPRDSNLNFSNRFEIWQTPGERYFHNIQYHGFEN